MRKPTTQLLFWYKNSINHGVVTMDAEKRTAVISTKEWFWALIVLCIPVFNLLVLFYWCFSKNVNMNKKNYSRAALLVITIEIFFAILFGLANASTVGL